MGTGELEKRFSEQITDWKKLIEELNEEISKFHNEVVETIKQADPYSNRVGFQVDPGSFLGQKVRLVKQLEAVWDECTGGFPEKFQAVYAEFERRDYPETLRRKVDKAYAVAFDTELASRLLDTSRDLEARATELQKTTIALQAKSNDYVHGKVSLSLEIDVMYDSQNSLHGVSPISGTIPLFSIMGFPGQSYNEIALRFLKAAHQDGFPYFEFGSAGFMDDDHLTTITDPEAGIGEIKGRCDQAPELLRGVDLSGVKSLCMAVCDLKDIPDHVADLKKYHRIDLYKNEEENIIIRNHLASTPKFLSIFDHVADSYHKK